MRELIESMRQWNEYLNERKNYNHQEQREIENQLLQEHPKSEMA